MQSALTFIVGAAYKAQACPRIKLARPPHFDAVVSLDPNDDQIAPRFNSVQAALDSAGANAEKSAAPFSVLIAEGEWREKIVVRRANVHLLGAGRQLTRLHASDHAATLGADGVALGTTRSASFSVTAPGFKAADLSIENRFDYPFAIAQRQSDAVGANGLQAVSLYLGPGSNFAHFERVDLLGYQDTLFVDAGCSQFSDCKISGCVDFIFGAGNAWFLDCVLHSRVRPSRDAVQGYVCAPSTQKDQPYGLVFVNCLLSSDAEVTASSVMLGRAWRPTRRFNDRSGIALEYGDPNAVGAACFLSCQMGKHIHPQGWAEMSYRKIDGSRAALKPADARLSEFNSSGAGAHISVSRQLLSAAQARRMLASRS